MKKYIRSSIFGKDYNNYDKADGWTDEDIDLHVSIDQAARHWEDYPVPEDSFIGDAVLYSERSAPQYRKVKFIKYLRANPIFPPFYAPEEKKPFGRGVGPMYDGNNYKTYNIHDRYETQGVYDLLST